MFPENIKYFWESLSPMKSLITTYNENSVNIHSPTDDYQGKDIGFTWIVICFFFRLYSIFRL